jgi:hypothetical protein
MKKGEPGKGGGEPGSPEEERANVFPEFKL